MPEGWFLCLAACLRSSVGQLLNLRDGLVQASGQDASIQETLGQTWDAGQIISLGWLGNRLVAGEGRLGLPVTPVTRSKYVAPRQTMSLHPLSAAGWLTLTVAKQISMVTVLKPQS